MSDIKWTWLKELVSGPFTYEAKTGTISALVWLPPGEEWHIQVWDRTDPKSGYQSLYEGDPGFDTAADAKLAAETYIRRFADGSTSC